jgi:hypothetical protein
LSIGVQILTDSALNLLRRASGRSEEEERHADRQKLRDPELEKVIRSENADAGTNSPPLSAQARKDEGLHGAFHRIVPESIGNRRR